MLRCTTSQMGIKQPKARVYEYLYVYHDVYLDVYLDVSIYIYMHMNIYICISWYRSPCSPLRIPSYTQSFIFVICCNVLTGGQLVDVSQETGLVLFPSVVASFPAPVDGRNPIR
jgi:hypothetical protein